MNRMKSLLAVSVLALGLFTVAAQTPPPLPAATNGLPAFTDTFSTAALGGLAHTIGDQISGLNFHEGVSVNPFVLYHQGDLGGGVSVHTANTNGLRLGIALAAVDEHDVKSGIFNKGKGHFEFYDATINLGAKGTFVVPLLNITLDLFVEDGPAFNALHPDQVYNQALAGASKTFMVMKHPVTVQGGIGHCSRWSTPFYEAGIGMVF